MKYEQAPAEIISSLKVMADQHVSNYGNYPSHVAKFGMPNRAVWRREWFEAMPNHTLSIQVDNSSTSRYVGIIEFSVRRHLTVKRRTREQAEGDRTSALAEDHKHRHSFIYDNNKWVPNPRVNKWRDRASNALEWLIFIAVLAAVGIPVALLLGAFDVRIKRLPTLIGIICGAFVAYYLDKIILHKIRGDQCTQYYPFYKTEEFRLLKDRGA